MWCGGARETRVTCHNKQVVSKRETTKNLLAFQDLSGILFTKVKNFKKRKFFFHWELLQKSGLDFWVNIIIENHMA